MKRRRRDGELEAVDANENYGEEADKEHAEEAGKDTSETNRTTAAAVKWL